MIRLKEELMTCDELVYEILNKYPKTRSSDNLLFLLAYEQIGKVKNIDIDDITLSNFLIHMREYGFPTFETLRRSRQKMQAAYPELAATDAVEGYRIVNEEVFKDYARKKW